MTAIRGNPGRLEEYTATTLPMLPPLRDSIASYGDLVRALAHAPSDVDPRVADRSPWLEGEVDALGNIDRGPAAFAFALRQLDHFVPDTPRDRRYLYTSDSTMFDALVTARLANPNGADADVYRQALDQVTGTPQALASEMRGIIEQIDASMNRDDVRDLQAQLLQLMQSIDENAAVAGEPLTAEEVVRQAWVVLNAREGDTVPADLVHRLQDLTDRLGRRRYDSDYTTAFFEALGPDLTASLPRTITLASWSDHLQSSGNPAFSVDNALVAVDVALAQASPRLDQSWCDDLFDGVVHDGTVDDAFPLLFDYGRFSTSFAQPAGQLGLDILHGTVSVDRGVGSPGYPDFDVLATDWEARGTVLLDAAARTPEAASALLGDTENAGWVTSDSFGRDGRHTPDWGVIDASVGRLILSGTVDELRHDEAAARMAAANIISGAIDEGRGRASDALATIYGEMTLQYLPDFSRSPAFNAPPVYDTVGGAHIQIGAYQAAQFASLAMHDDGVRDRILRLRDLIDLQIAVDGMNGQLQDPVWHQRLANVDGIVLSAANGQDFIAASAADDAAAAFNDRIDFLQDVGLSIVGLKWDLPGPVGVLADRGLQELKDSYLYHEMDHVEQARHATSVAGFSLYDHERFVIAEAQLAVAVHDEVAGSVTTDQRAFIAHANETLGADYVDAMRAAARGDTDVTFPSVDDHLLKDFAGYASIEDFTTVSNYTQLLLPADPQGLW